MSWEKSDPDEELLTVVRYTTYEIQKKLDKLEPVTQAKVYALLDDASESITKLLVLLKQARELAGIENENSSSV